MRSGRSGILRAELETALGTRVTSPFTDLEQRVRERVPTGIASLDSSTGGLPRGAITEIAGSLSSGRTSIALSILAAGSDRGEACAFVDGMDAFDPASGAASGIDLRRLLWIRCRTLDQTLRSTDLLLQGGGFGLVVADLSDLPQQNVRSVPLASWFRLQRVIENTPTSLLLLVRESVAKSAAALALHTSLKHTEQTGLLLSAHHLDLEIIRSRNPMDFKSKTSNLKFKIYPPHVCRHPYS